MKTLSKTLLCAAIALSLGSGSAFAKGKQKMNTRNNHKAGYGRHMTLNNKQAPESALIGQITFVDEKNGTVKIKDADGNEISVIVNPFTKIRINDSKEEKSFSDLKKDDWILYSLFNTETEKKIAARIYVKTK